MVIKVNGEGGISMEDTVLTQDEYEEASEGDRP